MMHRARVVFNGPVDREYVFYSVAKRSSEEVEQMLFDMKPALVYAVSVSTQYTDDPEGKGGWQVASVLRHWEKP